MGTRNKLELTRLASGDIVYRYEKSIVVVFWGKRHVLSTSTYNGGYHDDYEAVFNQDGTVGEPGVDLKYVLLAESYDEHMAMVAEKLGLDPEKVTGMSTAAQMENASIKSYSYDDITVTAIVTAGIDKNGGRVGDPAVFLGKKEKQIRLGTINIILCFNVDLPPGTMARALVTCTEAKTAALQELMAGSCFSSGIATGSGTDQTIIISDSRASLCIENVGKHCKTGELIGKAVKEAVKEALDKQYPHLNPKNQHNILQRLKRYDVSEETVWRFYKKRVGENLKAKEDVLKVLHEIATNDEMVTLGVSYIHLIDEMTWGLLSRQEAKEMGMFFLGEIARRFDVEKPKENDAALFTFAELLASIVVKRV